MNNYVDRYGLFHHKPVINGEPSSNNGFLHTAVAYRLRIDFNLVLVHYTFRLCLRDEGDFTIDRLPNIDSKRPPFSVDEMIGVNVLLLGGSYSRMDNYSWTRIPKYPLWVTIKSFWYLLGKHRNTIWWEKVYPAYALGFKALPHNQYYFGNKKMFIFWQLYKYKTLFFGDSAEKILLWVQLEDMGTTHNINIKKHLLKVYPLDHPFNNLGK